MTVALLWDRLCRRGVMEDSGSDRIFPYRASISYNGLPGEVRFGAFLGWPVISGWPVVTHSILHLLADRLEEISMEEAGLLQLVDIAHQAAGHCCIENIFIARSVAIAPAALPFANEICSRFYHAGGGWFEPGEQLGLTASYEAMVVSHGFDLYDHAMPSRQRPMEAIYPIAGSGRNIANFVENYPAVLQQLAPLMADPDLHREMLILLLADNSD